MTEEPKDAKRVDTPAIGKAKRLPPVTQPRQRPGVARRLLSGKRGRR